MQGCPRAPVQVGQIALFWQENSGSIVVENEVLLSQPFSQIKVAAFLYYFIILVQFDSQINNALHFALEDEVFSFGNGPQKGLIFVERLTYLVISQLNYCPFLLFSSKVLQKGLFLLKLFFS